MISANIGLSKCLLMAGGGGLMDKVGICYFKISGNIQKQKMWEIVQIQQQMECGWENQKLNFFSFCLSVHINVMIFVLCN